MNDHLRRYLPWLLVALTMVISILFFIFRPAADENLPDTTLDTANVTPSGSLIPSDAPVEGPFSAKVAIVEFLDYQCPSCGAYHPLVKRMREVYAGKVRFVVRQFPLVEIHAYAKGASVAAICAHRQGKFFLYTDYAIERQDKLTRNDLEQYAADLGLDQAAFKTCLDDPSVAAQVVQDRVDGESFGVNGTPTFFVNGRILRDLPTSEEEFKALIDTELAR